MNCSNCGHLQATGSFCSVCGNSFEDFLLDSVNKISFEEATLKARQTPNNIYVENLKKKSNIYRTYFMQRLRQPSLAYNRGKTEFASSLISIILFTTLFTLALFLFANDFYRTNSPSFFSFFVEVFLLTSLLIAIVVFSLFLTNYFFGPQHTFRSIIKFYGGQLPPFIIGIIFSILLMLVKSFTYGNGLLTLCLIVAVFILPLYVISFLLTKNPTGVDPLYGFILYIVVFTILFTLFVTIAGDSTLGGYFYNK